VESKALYVEKMRPGPDWMRAARHLPAIALCHFRMDARNIINVIVSLYQCVMEKKFLMPKQFTSAR
jgi:hypothetical protein